MALVHNEMLRRRRAPNTIAGIGDATHHPSARRTGGAAAAIAAASIAATAEHRRTPFPPQLSTAETADCQPPQQNCNVAAVPCVPPLDAHVGLIEWLDLGPGRRWEVGGLVKETAERQTVGGCMQGERYASGRLSASWTFQVPRPMDELSGVELSPIGTPSPLSAALTVLP